MVLRIDADVFKFRMKRAFERRSVITVDDGVGVENKRYAGIAQFPDSVSRVQATCESYLHHVVAERTDVRNDIDVAGPRAFGHRLRTHEFGVSFREVFLKNLDLGLECVQLRPNDALGFCLCLVEQVLIAGLFFFGPFHVSDEPLLLALQSGSFGAFITFSLHLLSVFVREIKLLQFELQVFVRDEDRVRRVDYEIPFKIFIVSCMRFSEFDMCSRHRGPTSMAVT